MDDKSQTKTCVDYGPGDFIKLSELEKLLENYQ